MIYIDQSSFPSSTLLTDTGQCYTIKKLNSSIDKQSQILHTHCRLLPKDFYPPGTEEEYNYSSMRALQLLGNPTFIFLQDFNN